MTLHTPPLDDLPFRLKGKVTVLCERCGGPLWPWDANGGCATCGIRPDERLVDVSKPRGNGLGDGWEWRLGRDGKKRAVWRKA